MHTRQFEEVSPAQCGVDRNAEIEVRGWKEIKRYVELGFGISMIPSICVSKSDRLSVISLPDHFPSLSFGVFTRPRPYPRPARPAIPPAHVFRLSLIRSTAVPCSLNVSVRS